MNNTNIEQIIEACLLTATTPISLSQLINIFDAGIDEIIVKQALSKLEHRYATSGVEMVNIAGGYRFRSRIEFQPYLNKLYQVKPPKYSRAIMETLAIIAYKQPVTRGEIEDIRGVTINSNVIQTLMERGWIEVVGQKQVPGKPELLATTSKLLEDLGLKSLEELPELPNIEQASSDIDLIEEYDEQKHESN